MVLFSCGFDGKQMALKWMNQLNTVAGDVFLGIWI